MEQIFNFTDSVAEGFRMLYTAIELPIALLEYCPVVIGSAITVVVGVMIVKFILGR